MAVARSVCPIRLNGDWDGGWVMVLGCEVAITHDEGFAAVAVASLADDEGGEVRVCEECLPSVCEELGLAVCEVYRFDC